MSRGPRRRVRATRAVRSAVAALAATGLAAGVLAGCTSSGDTADTAAVATAPPAIQPGRPGERNTTGSPSIASETWSTADVEFAAKMIPHHAQALQMSALAPDHARSPKVKAMAARIEAEQKPEIELFKSWLRERGQEVPEADGGMAGHDHGSMDMSAPDMPGMATPEQLAALAAADGTAFDRMFLTLMIRHHQGALTMADARAAGGMETRMGEMASEVSV